MSEQEDKIVEPNRFENLIPPDSALANSRTVYGESIADLLGEILNNKKIEYIIILGEPGSGKTVILRELAKLFQSQRTDKKLRPHYYDDIHYFIQKVTGISSANWAKSRNEGSPDFWTLASTIIYNCAIAKEDDETVLIEGVWSGEEDRLRSTTLKLISDFGKGKVGILYVLPHPDVQQAAISIRDWVNMAKPEDVTEGLRAFGVEPNSKFPSGDSRTGEIIKNEIAKSAQGFEIATISAEIRSQAFEWLNAYRSILDELLSEILNPNNPDVPPFMGDAIRAKAVLVIEQFEMLGIDITPIINLPVKGILDLHVSEGTSTNIIDANFLKNLLAIIASRRESGEWDQEYVGKWFPNLYKLTPPSEDPPQR